MLTEDKSVIEFSSWKEVENYLNVELLKPDYLPTNYELDTITLSKSGTRTVLLVIYENRLSCKDLSIEVDFFEGDYSERTLVNDPNWILLKDFHDGLNSKYYTSDKYKSVKVMFTKDKKMYILLCQESVQELKKIAESMK